MNENKSSIKREFVFGTYCPNRVDRNKDAVFVKEILHKDGMIKRNLRMIENYQRPFYITKPNYRDHQQKKEFEHLAKLDTYYTNQANLSKSIFKVLNGYRPNNYISIQDMNESPYVYGTDVATPVLIANDYKTKYPDLLTPSTLAVLDYETDVVMGKEYIISGVLAMKDKLHIAVSKEFLGYLAKDAKELIKQALNKYLSEYMEKNKIEPIITIVDKPSDVVLALIKSAHTWQPDFVACWNIKFDMNKMLEALAMDDIDPAFAFSDPSVPPEYRFFRWREDKDKKSTASGKVTPKHIADKWHTATCPASFYFICLMAVHRTVRARDPYRSSYKLDAVLKDFGVGGKLKFENLQEGLTELDWHKEMQRMYKIEYMVYMAWDGGSAIELDQKTKDASNSVRGMIGLSELSNMKSNPKRLSDDMYFELLKEDKVLTGTSNCMRDELDALTPSLVNWIITLPSELEHHMGRALINEYPKMHTNITTHAFDIDVVSAYPKTEIALNVSKTTRALELCKISGLSDKQQKSLGINMTNVKVNALSLAEKAYKFPDVDVLLQAFINQM